MFRGRVRQVHFIGVGGIGMSGLAEILRTLGFDVSGSDMKEGETTRRLARLGVRIDIGHAAENVRGADVIVYSSAIRESNPEMQAARAAQIPVITRAEMLAELMRVKYGVAIAGSHGKTTTTSLVATLLRAAGLDPTVVVGGRMEALGTNARLGAGDLLVAEADESDGSFLRLTPTVAVVTNIDPEHLDFYGTHQHIKDAFVTFIEKVPFYGLAVLCLDHPAVQDLLPRVRRRHVTYGLSPQADYSARALSHRGTTSSFVAYRRREPLGEFELRMPGRHNVLNALAAIAVGDELEVPLDEMKEALATFGGVARRFSVVAEVGGVTLVDDYGHHPAEIQATLTAARGAFSGRVIVAFQPHRYSRTQDLFDDFVRAFNDADHVLVTDVYPAGEAPIPGVDSEALVRAIREHGHQQVSYVRDRAELASELGRLAAPGDGVIALGAGDINRVLPHVRAALESRKA
ncbi:MAG: UDP-N-acetylmuramate--L-alanine ligase [Polyangiaceae bacterium]|nr:UDP-N-acetylmuramate--L-alanine ligase [Polyangiaceae bacterium]MCW5790683.1 UDP-N-acetylmuramate--L-alanine ligase [Polyangiaceae bacterium]